ncbi:hypothetical protein QBC40DRAFT_256409 [Triangularia verruculosa]|uniref:Uncharacterized protein n=1 Tax=Triangularia verruculosa TaxID=2587418 RepID=A0AAN6XEW2_9PEZI|nr:hypothetical protein QBC40DRAFT_256409 [Triangularia verruculosa]
MISAKIISVVAAAIAATPAFASAIPAVEKRQRAPGASITYWEDNDFKGAFQFFDKDRKDMQCYNLPSEWQNRISSYTNHNELDWCCRWWADLDCPDDKPQFRTQTANQLGGSQWNDAIKSYRCEANAEDFCYDPPKRDAVSPQAELEERADNNEGYGSVTFCKDPQFQGDCSSFDNKNPGSKALPLGTCVNFPDEWRNTIDSFRNDEDTTCCSWFSELDCGGNRFSATVATNITHNAFHDHIQSIECWDITDTDSCIRDDLPAE